MLKMIFYCIFLIPLMSKYWLMSNMIAMLSLIYMLIYNKNLIMIGYMMQIDNISYGLIILSIWITFLMIVSSNSYKNNMMFLFLLLVLMVFLILSFSSFIYCPYCRVCVMMILLFGMCCRVLFLFVFVL